MNDTSRDIVLVLIAAGVLYFVVGEFRKNHTIGKSEQHQRTPSNNHNDRVLTQLGNTLS